MTVKSHWSVLKRHRLRNFHRPRSDLFVYLMDKNLFPNYEEKLSLLTSGRSKLVWWYRFTSSWEKEVASEIRNSYEISHERWICQCPADKNNEFLLWKHLVKGKTMPNYSNLGRLNKPPFIISNFVVDRPFSNTTYEFREDVEANILDRDICTFLRSFRVSIESTEEHNFITEAGDLLKWWGRHLDYLEGWRGSREQKKYSVEKLWTLSVKI